MDKKDIMITLRTFLRLYGVLDTFISNTNRHNDKMKFKQKSEYKNILGAFIWKNAKGGLDVWIVINNQWLLYDKSSIAQRKLLAFGYVGTKQLEKTS